MDRPLILDINEEGLLYDCSMYRCGIITTEKLEQIISAAKNSLKHNKKHSITPEMIEVLDQDHRKELDAKHSNPSVKESVVLSDLYLIHDTTHNSLKIGITKNINKRISQLQSSNASDLKLLFLIKEKSDIEQALHKKFSHLKIKFEWFRFSEEIISHFKNLSDGVSL